MNKSTKIIASIAVSFVVVASIVAVSLFKSDDSKELESSLPVNSTTLPIQQPVETVSAFDWDAYLNSLDLSTVPESSTLNPSDVSTSVPLTNPNVIISVVYPSDYVPQTPPSTTKQQVTTTQLDRIEISDFQYRINTENDTLILTKYVGSKTIVHIPEELNGKTVSVIGNDCFKKSKLQTKITAVYVPESVISVSNAAFNGCQSLEKVYFYGQNHVEIGDSAFENCTSLKTVALSSKTTSIGANAFAKCTSLKEIRIPETVTVFGNNPFAACSSDLTIICKTGSEAESIADMYKINVNNNY